MPCGTELRVPSDARSPVRHERGFFFAIDAVVRDRRHLDVREPQHLGRPVALLDDRFHGLSDVTTALDTQ
jgi:hypothetical protein